MRSGKSMGYSNSLEPSDDESGSERCVEFLVAMTVGIVGGVCEAGDLESALREMVHTVLVASLAVSGGNEDAMFICQSLSKTQTATVANGPPESA